uniref:Uncharacterized protein n=1 Tax=Anguilla anguilla TaxID=7936 RepID=A0A0E9SXV9_ANGAN
MQLPLERQRKKEGGGSRDYHKVPSKNTGL